MSGPTWRGSIIVKAGRFEVETTSGLVIHVDSPISRELADVLVQVIEAEGLTTSDVMAVEFFGEGRPILTTTDEVFQREQVQAIRRGEW